MRSWYMVYTWVYIAILGIANALRQGLHFSYACTVNHNYVLHCTVNDLY